MLTAANRSCKGFLDVETASGIEPGLFDTAPAKVVSWGLARSVRPRTDEHAMQTYRARNDAGTPQTHRVAQHHKNCEGAGPTQRQEQA